jgi:class 3 adenylate cyclase
VLATVLFTDIVGSTERAVELGDHRWRDLLEAHHDTVRRQLSAHGGHEIHTAGDGFLATFDGPARAVLAAVAIRDAVQRLGLQIRAGLHTGEVQLRQGGIGGVAVHIGARVAAGADPGDVVVTRTVKDLVAGSRIRFSDLGNHSLKGVPDEWQLFRVLA